MVEPLRAAAALLAVILAGGGCGISPPFSTPPPADLPTLEARHSEDPTAIDAAVRLAAGYVAEGNLEDARSVLLRTHERVPSDPTIRLVLAVVEQELGLYPLAGARYRMHLRAYPSGPLASRVQARLDAIDAAVRRSDALALLDGRSVSDLDLDGIGILPFAYQEGDAAQQAWAFAFAEILTARLSRIRAGVVKAADVRALVQVMEPQPAELASLAQARRVSDLMGVGHVVQGDLRESEDGLASIDLLVSSRTANGRLRLVAFSETGPVQSSLEMLARLSISVLDALDEPLPGARVRELARHGVREVEALEPFGRALITASRADHEQARLAYQEASTIDPSSERLAQDAARAEALLLTLGMPAGTTVEEAGRVGELQRVTAAVREGVTSPHRAASARLAANRRVPLAEVLGRDRLGLNGLLELTFRLPGAGR